MPDHIAVQHRPHLSRAGGRSPSATRHCCLRHWSKNGAKTTDGRPTPTAIAFWQRGRGHNHQPRGRGKKSSKHIEILYVDRPQFATLLLPLTSTGFYPDGNSPGKSMKNSGKQNPKMGFKSPPSRNAIL